MSIRMPRITLRFLLILVAVVSVPISIVAPWFNHPAPKAVVMGGPTARCGTVSIGSYRRHTWTIRNEGRADLVLVVSRMSPRCGLSLWDGENRVVPPGGQTEIQLTYPTPDRDEARFAMFADLATNEEGNPKVRLQVEGMTGRVESKATAEPVVPFRVKP